MEVGISVASLRDTVVDNIAPLDFRIKGRIDQSEF